MVLMAACGVATLHYGDAGTLPEGVGAGGILGAVVGHAFFAAFNFLGATVVMLGMLLVGWALLTRVSWLTVMEATGRLTLSLFASVAGRSERRRERREVSHARRERVQTVAAKTRRNPRRKQPPRIEPVLSEIEPSPRATRERQTVLFEPAGPRLPELAQLDRPPTGRPRCRPRPRYDVPAGGGQAARLRDRRRGGGRPPRAGHHPLRASAIAGPEGEPGHRPGQGPRPIAVDGERADRRDHPREIRHRPRGPERRGRAGLPERDLQLRGL